MLKKISLILFAVIFSLTSSAQTYTWYNPEDVGFHVIQGQAYQGQAREGFYHRLPAKAKQSVRKAVWDLGKHAAGESICFSTDARDIVVRYKVKLRLAMNHMPATGVSGVDLYSYDKHGKEVWLTPKYSFKDTISYRYSSIEMQDPPKGRLNSYTLYLPLYNEVEWMEIGVTEGAKFCFDAPLPVKPIVAYGTSICQGACACRPAMAWTNILQRRLDRPVVNLGFSGNAMHEKEVVDLLKEIDAAVYIIDGLPNSRSIPAPMLRDTLISAVRRIREARPETPVLLVDHPGFPQGKVYKAYKTSQEHANNSVEDVYQHLVKEGVTNLYRLRCADIGMGADMLVEGIHMSDYGMVTYANAYEKILREILNEPVGKHLTTIPVRQQRDSYNWMDRHHDILNSSVGRHYRRVVIGDSIMHFWGGVEGAPAQRGTDSWDALGGETFNMGCGHDRTENVLWRIYHGQLDALTADKIIIKIGTNNIPQKYTDEEIVAGIEAIVLAVQSRRPEAEVKVMGVLPRRGREERVRNLNDSIKSLAKGLKVEFADPGKRLLDKKGKILESYFTDGLHPNAEGYRIIADDFR